MKFLYCTLTLLATTTFSLILAATTTAGPSPTTAAPQPVYKPSDNYVPHATYPYSETYPVPGYDGFLVPAGSVQYQPNDDDNDDTSVSSVPVSLQFKVCPRSFFASHCHNNNVNVAISVSITVHKLGRN